MLEDIARLHSEGRLDEAESAYRVLLASDADQVDVLHLLGMLRRERGDRDEARRLLDRARILAPDRCDVLLELAGLHFVEGDMVGARALLERIVKLDPNLPGAYTLLAQVAELQGHASQAESLFRTALRLSDTDPQALGGLGRVLLDSDNVDKAIGYLTRAAELAPKNPSVQSDLARAFTLLGNVAFAEQAAKNALALRPELHAARRVLAHVLLQQGRLEEAEAAYAVLSEVPAQRAFALFGRGDVARQSNNPDRAIDHYRAALALQPGQPLAVLALGSCLAALGRDTEVVELYTNHLVSYPDALQIEGALADQHLQNGRFGSALEAWQALAIRRPNDPVPVQRLAVLCEFLGDAARASALAEQVAGALPDDAELILLRVRAALREGRDNDAAALLDSVRPLVLNPVLVMQAAHLYGVLADRRGEVAQSVPAWLEAQASQPAAVHALAEFPPALAQRLLDGVPAATLPAPIFLLGLPGSMVERVAALLHEQADVALLRDRPFAANRNDDFASPRFDDYLAGLDATTAQTCRERWAREVAATGVDPQVRIIDWLSRWDARFAPLLQQAFAGATIVIVERDPRDLLLNWLAYGWMPGFPVHDLEAAARWLASARLHLDVLDKLPGLQVIRVNADQLLADPARYGQGIAAALGRAQLKAGTPQLSRGGLVPGMPAGRWQAYAEVLAPAFAALGPID